MHLRILRPYLTIIVVTLFIAACGDATSSETNGGSTPSSAESEVSPVSLDSSPTEEATPTETTPTVGADVTEHSSGQHLLSAPAIVGSLDERVKITPIIVIGTFEARVETINAARVQSNPREPDPHVLGLGQVYEVAVEQYLKGSGANTLFVVQAEGFLYSEDEPIGKASPIPLEIENRARVGYEADDIKLGEQYMMFIEPLTWTDKYLGPAFGFPWVFSLSETEGAKAESPFPEAKTGYEVVSVDEFVTAVEQLVKDDG